MKANPNSIGIRIALAGTALVGVSTVGLETRASKECKNPKLKEFATKTLPTLQEHLDMARKLETKVKQR